MIKGGARLPGPATTLRSIGAAIASKAADETGLRAALPPLRLICRNLQPLAPPDPLHPLVVQRPTLRVQ
jgi:hypothetical protein